MKKEKSKLKEAEEVEEAQVKEMGGGED